MLVRFSVENYRSFNDRQVFSMSASKHTRHKNHVITANGRRLLKSSVIFGANASGKSNLIKAIYFGKRITLNGLSSGRIAKCNFRIDKESLDRPGIFQYDFLSNGHFYSYGFAFSYRDAKFISEWLYIVDGEKEKKVFERDINEGITNGLTFSNKENEQRFDIYSEDTEDNKSFLSEVTSHKLDKMNDYSPYFDVKDWFDSLLFIFPQTKLRNYGQYILNNDTLDSTGKLLNFFDTGIESVSGKEVKFDEALLSIKEELREKLKNDIYEAFSEAGKFKKVRTVECNIAGNVFIFTKNDEGDIKVQQLVTNHGNPEDLFDLSDESDGTKRLFDLIPLYKRGKQNFTIFVDELDRSFHSKLTIEFINRFFSVTQGDKAQLIVTLHDTNVMNLNLLRQDEIWFVERREDHSSELYSLNKFKERFDHLVAKDYLLGRYGSVPNFGIDPWEEED